MSAVPEASPSIRRGTTSPRSGSTRWAASLPDYVRMVSAGERDFCSALEEMTRVEVAAREARIVRQRIRSSGFPYVKGLADFDWDFQPSVPRARIEELATLRFIERAENVLLVGSPGVGKTHLAVAIGIEAVRAGREVRFMDCARLVEDLQDAQARGILKKRLKYYAHSKLLVIDELGYLDIGEGGATCSSSSSRRATSRGRPSSPPTSASAGGGRSSGTTWRRAPSRTASATTATSSRSRAGPTG